MSRQVLVTGASGFIAQQLILDLLAGGHRVRGTVRSLAKGEALKQTLAEHSERGAELELVEADLEGDAGWDAAAEGVDVVHHVASPFPLASPNNEMDLIRPAREGTLRVLRAARHAGAKRVVLTSSAAAIAYGWGRDAPEVFNDSHWTQLDGPRPVPPYQKSKTLAEHAAWDFAKAEGMELTAVNPVGVFGPIRSADVRTSVGIVAQLLAGRFPALPRAGVEVVDVRDVAAVHIAAQEDPGTIGQRLVVSDAFFWFRDVADVLREAFPDRAGRIPTRGLPDFVVRLGALFSADLATIAGELGVQRRTDASKARALLGRDLISGRDALVASGASLIRYGAV
jgi:dihydroflavonol-4-reductase